jgi:hypothetical protein
MASVDLKRTFRKGTNGIIAFVASVCLVLSGGQAASADSLDGTCEASEACQYRLAGSSSNSWGSGGQVDTAGQVSAYWYWTYLTTSGSNGINANDRATKLWCRGNSMNCRWWQHQEWSGWTVNVTRGSSRDLTGTNYDNAISSLSWY